MTKMTQLMMMVLLLACGPAAENPVVENDSPDVAADADAVMGKHDHTALDEEDEEYEQLQAYFAYEYFYFHGQDADGRQLVMSLVAPNIFDPRAFMPGPNGVPPGTRDRAGSTIAYYEPGQMLEATQMLENVPQGVSFTAQPWRLQINNNVVTREKKHGKRYYRVQVDTIDTMTGMHATGELTFKATSAGIKIDGGSLFDNPATNDFQKTYTIMPSAEMSGTITYTSAAGDCQSFSFDRVLGYAEKTFGTVPLQTALDAFYWNHARLPNGETVYVYHQTGTQSTDPGTVQRPDVDRVIVIGRDGKLKLAANKATFTIGPPGSLMHGNLPIASSFTWQANGYTVEVRPTALTMAVNPLLPTYARFLSTVLVTPPFGKKSVTDVESLGDQMIFR